MGMQSAGQNRLYAGHALRHQHGFGCRGRAVVQRCVGHLHAGQQRHLRLEFEKILQRALRNFRLIRRVGGEKFRTLDQMIDGGRNVMLIGARAAEEGPAPAAVFFAASFDSARSTSSSPCVSGRSKAESGTTADLGTSRNSASISRRADLGEHRRAVGRGEGK